MKNTIDLNLYRFLYLLSQQKSQAKVCHTLDISKATFTRQLAECRLRFDNELFNAEKGVYTPTLLCQQLCEAIGEPLEQLEQIPQLAKTFNANQYSNEYVFSIINPLSGMLTIPLVTALTTDEQKPKISFIDWSIESIENPKRGAVAIGIGGFPNELNERMVERKVASVPIFAYVNAQHPLHQQTELELSDIENLETVRVSMGSLDVNAYYERMRKLTGVNLEQKLTVSSMTAALDCVKVSPYVFVGMYIDDQELPAGICRLPLKLEGTSMLFDVGIQYHRAFYQHPIIAQVETFIKRALS
ncbi:LysR family transcriptional regulator [Vibrio rotiferianus]|uniref:LysR family transcriptional regulator n=1 Tax=Vibrio rotiferianus TaxID=190895 RepID=UPI0003A6DDAD|nr:LysR family transcriptional regulator [Vibrio rotiferianus]PIB17140.1 transcriptional regulator [Vibrio rotiferianus CAIM 577 = LMG 21460]